MSHQSEERVCRNCTHVEQVKVPNMEGFAFCGINTHGRKAGVGSKECYYLAPQTNACGSFTLRKTPFLTRKEEMNQADSFELGFQSNEIELPPTEEIGRQSSSAVTNEALFPEDIFL